MNNSDNEIKEIKARAIISMVEINLVFGLNRDEEILKHIIKDIK